jgi:hypothetical protein
MCSVWLFALFDIISGTLNSIPFKCCCCFNPRTITRTVASRSYFKTFAISDWSKILIVYKKDLWKLIVKFSNYQIIIMLVSVNYALEEINPKPTLTLLNKHENICNSSCPLVSLYNLETTKTFFQNILIILGLIIQTRMPSWC